MNAPNLGPSEQLRKPPSVTDATRGQRLGWTGPRFHEEPFPLSWSLEVPGRRDWVFGLEGRAYSWGSVGCRVPQQPEDGVGTYILHLLLCKHIGFDSCSVALLIEALQISFSVLVSVAVRAAQGF